MLFAAPVRNRSNDVDHEYHQDPDLYYLTGLREPNAVLFVFKEPQPVNGREVKELLVVRVRDPKREVWDGERLGSEGAMVRLGLEMAITGEDLLQVTMAMDERHTRFMALPKDPPANDPRDPADLQDLMATVADRTAKAEHGPPERLRNWLAAMREVKLPEEIALLRRAIDITCEAQVALMKALFPGMTEFQSEAVVQFVFTARGAEHEGYPSILGSGRHSCVLHYVTNRRIMANGDLLVSDVGAEYHGYTADVTRTLPVNGRFSTEQKAIYELVLKAQDAGIAAVKPGAPFRGAHEAATEVITQGLIRLGLIQKADEVKRYFMHGTSHYLGLDVHDPGTYGPLKVNTVLTVEPGIYIPQGSPCDPKWWDIGVRIEDDVLVTADGCEVLSDCVPRSIAEVEALMAEPWDGVLPGLR